MRITFDLFDLVCVAGVFMVVDAVVRLVIDLRAEKRMAGR